MKLISRAPTARAGSWMMFSNKLGYSRRIALTVPSFTWALALIGESDFIGTLPRSFVRKYGERFGVVAIEPPTSFGHFQIQAVAPKAAMTDAGVAWLMDRLQVATINQRATRKR